MKNISILGAGWLGTPLAEKILQQGHQVKVSTTTTNKQSYFEEQNIPCFVFNLDCPIEETTLHDFFKDTDILIITIPPGKTERIEGNYIARIEKIIEQIQIHQIPEVIFTSSTTVYYSLKGLVSEDDKVEPTSEMDRDILQIERLLLDNQHFNASILRLGGLIGNDRHPVYYICQRELINDANDPVNMVHQEDIIRFVEKMILEPIPNEIFNIVAPISLNRRDFYTQEAQRLGIGKIPTFVDNPNAKLRKVSGEKISKRYHLDYTKLI
ncbi:MAG: NAD(P)-binding domain-containing protein [Bacteroidota bacterium]|nr:NAD(P)-binding domain-containing protein [Bacteroidota bacterium]